MDNSESFYDVFVKVLEILTTDKIVLFAMTSWSIWKKRNLQLWEQKIETIEQVIHRAQGVLQAWQYAQRRRDDAENNRQQENNIRW
jgi:hypothetical protein